MHSTTRTVLRLTAALSAGALALLAATGAGASVAAGDHSHGNGHHHHSGQALTASVVLSGASLVHSFVPMGSTTSQTESLSKPDDITQLGRRLFVGFQNGVGPEGGASPSGNLDSTVVELTLSGHVVAQWDVEGKVDGLTADPRLHGVIATVNEDAGSALYTIQPSAPTPVTEYAYNGTLPHLGGTDAISIYRGRILISASAPGTTGSPATPTPAVYEVALDPTARVATATTLFNDQDAATVATVGSSSYGKTVTLALTDPDSNEVVPPRSPRFAGDFVLTSQGDLEQIYVHDAGGPHQQLSVLSLTQSVDDTAWPSFGGRLYATDSTDDTVDVVTGGFDPRQPIVVATPCGANAAPLVCPSPPMWPANYLATLDLSTGQVTPLTVGGATFTPQGGLAFVATPPLIW